MRPFLIFLLFIFTGTGQLRAQSTGTLRGVVVDVLTQVPLPDAAVTNLATGATTLTDEGGRFSIAAQPGQEIGVTLIGYGTVKRTVPPAGSGLMHIKLRADGARLEEVIVRPDYTPYQRDSARRAATYRRALSRQRSSAMSPFSFVLERILPSQRRLFGFQKEFQRMEEERFMESRYNPEIVASLTGLTGDTLGAFISAHPMPADFARAATELEIKAWIRAAYKDWRAKGSPLSLPLGSTLSQPD